MAVSGSGGFDFRSIAQCALLSEVPGPRHRHAVSDLLDLLGRRWMLRVLWELRDGDRPYTDLRRACDEMSTSVLAARLRELEAAGLAARTADGWALTPAGRRLLEVLAPLDRFARDWRAATS